MKRKKFLAVLCIAFTAVLLSLPSIFPALADGGLFGKNGRDISEPGQKAVIFFNKGVEEMVLSVRYDGAAGEFAWLVPTPEPPKIDESNASLFTLMSEFTTVPGAEDVAGNTLNGSVQSGWGGVDVLDERTVGPFDISVVRSASAGDLRAWLVERGFAYDDRAEEVLADYIERGWCFTAMRVTPSSAWDGSYLLSQGAMTPLRFTFNAPHPVYPLYISSLNPGQTEVLLYVLGPELYTHESMHLEYAERWGAVQIGALEDFSVSAAEMAKDGGCYITKLRHTFSPEQMQDLNLLPDDAVEYTRWPGQASLAVGSTGGSGASDSSFPWWGLLAAAVMLGAIVAAVFGLTRPAGEARFKKTAVVFLAVAVLSSAILFPLEEWVFSGDREEVAAPQVDWPWSDDILVTSNGWSKLVHPDGRSEIVGLDDQLARLIVPVASVSFEGYHHASGDPMMPGTELGVESGEGGWEWTTRDHRDENSQTRYFRVSNPAGESHEIEISTMTQVEAVRLSPGGDRLWVAENPGIPVNTTEVREYDFPSLELRRSLIHNDCLSLGEGEIILSPEGEPLIAGRFSTGENDLDTCYGILPMFEENARYVGQPLEIKSLEGEDDNAVRSSGNDPRMQLMNSSFQDAMDASPFLLIYGYDVLTGQDMAYVLDTRDGELYEVGEGSPVGWR